MEHYKYTKQTDVNRILLTTWPYDLEFYLSVSLFICTTLAVGSFQHKNTFGFMFCYVQVPVQSSNCLVHFNVYLQKTGTLIQRKERIALVTKMQISLYPLKTQTQQRLKKKMIWTVNYDSLY